MSSISQIRTRFLILSDTHGHSLFDPRTKPDEAQQYAFREPLPSADVAIHCGDLTLYSHVKEYQKTFDMMRSIDAPLKLVIPGNHDCSLDVDFWEKDCLRRRHLPEEMMARLLRQPYETYEVVEQARQDGIHVLTEEGTYHFVLSNGARLTVYASAWTPEYGRWGFQYGEGGHNFAIEPETDVAITHGPPYMMLDRTRSHDDAGCPSLWAAVTRARPRVHCYGHIHESHGMVKQSWEGDGEQMVLERAVAGEVTRDIQPVSLCAGDEGSIPFEAGSETLFVNAAIMSVAYKPHQSPWVVDLELPSPDVEHKEKADKTQELLSRPRTLHDGPTIEKGS
ncbi:metallophosphoesterase domain-containing protein [Diaporthe helianthi]|uniref:Metallophosphoesterase domain-containing protein n=1 Tax=Diaporthe helianthi TaxID=158607 RepID=A0A2P5IFF9_DIAHE|nr:metallophosphoesterase domain-containing protein [Diaporthe helianthi]